MTIAYTPKDVALDVLAIALILAPEPVTTPIGIALLCRKRGGAQHEPGHPIHEFPEYSYRVETIRGRQITWEVRTVQPGQLPLHKQNRMDVNIKDREQLILSRTAPEKSRAQRIAESLPPGVKVHHEIFRPPRAPVSSGPAFVPGETIHHTLREYPSIPSINRGTPEVHIHHTIENSPGYIIAREGGASPSSQPKIIHHTIKDSPAVQHGNPANIVKPVRIVEHHTINQTPPIRYKGRLIQQPTASPPPRKGIILDKKATPPDR
jgi:hypothetical protein